MPRAKSSAKASTYRPRKSARKSSTARRARPAKPHRLGPLFYTVIAVTGLCALAFMGLVAGTIAAAG